MSNLLFKVFHPEKFGLRPDFRLTGFATMKG